VFLRYATKIYNEKWGASFKKFDLIDLQMILKNIYKYFQGQIQGQLLPFSKLYNFPLLRFLGKMLPFMAYFKMLPQIISVERLKWPTLYLAALPTQL